MRPPSRAAPERPRAEQQTPPPTLSRVRALSPEATLRRGYAILTDADGRTVTSIEGLEPEGVLVARVLDGEIAASVIDIEPHEAGGQP